MRVDKAYVLVSLLLTTTVSVEPVLARGFHIGHSFKRLGHDVKKGFHKEEKKTKNNLKKFGQDVEKGGKTAAKEGKKAVQAALKAAPKVGLAILGFGVQSIENPGKTIRLGERLLTVGYHFSEKQVVHGVKVAAKASYNGLVTGANATVKRMIEAGHTIEEAALKAAKEYQTLDTKFKLLTGGLGILDVLAIAFPEVAFAQGLAAVIQDPTDWHGWLQIASSAAGTGMLSGAAGEAFTLATDVATDSVVSNTIKVVQHPSAENIGNLVLASATSLATAGVEHDAIPVNSALRRAVTVGQRGQDAYKVGTSAYENGLKMKQAIEKKDWKSGLQAAADISADVGSTSLAKGQVDKIGERASYALDDATETLNQVSAEQPMEAEAPKATNTGASGEGHAQKTSAKKHKKKKGLNRLKKTFSTKNIETVSGHIDTLAGVIEAHDNKHADEKAKTAHAANGHKTEKHK